MVMKRVLVILMGCILLSGCGSNSQEMVKTMCRTDSSYSIYDSYEQIFESEGDAVKVITIKGVLSFDDKESLDEMTEMFDESVEEFNTMEGLNAKIERIDDTKVNDILEIDLSKANLELLSELGVLYIEEGSVSDYSLSQSITLAESLGLSCETIK